MDELIIKDEDLLEESHWPVEVAIGLFADENPSFEEIAKNASEGIGYLKNDAGIIFWDELDEFEKESETPFYVECVVLEDACDLTYAEFLGYLRLACKRYSEKCPEAAASLEGYLDAYSEKFIG